MHHNLMKFQQIIHLDALILRVQTARADRNVRHEALSQRRRIRARGGQAVDTMRHVVKFRCIASVFALGGWLLASCSSPSEPAQASPEADAAADTGPQPLGHPRLLYAPEHKAIVVGRQNQPPFDAVWFTPRVSDDDPCAEMRAAPHHRDAAPAAPAAK